MSSTATLWCTLRWWFYQTTHTHNTLARARQVGPTWQDVKHRHSVVHPQVVVRRVQLGGHPHPEPRLHHLKQVGLGIACRGRGSKQVAVAAGLRR